MMRWLAAWWRQITGPPKSDPWLDDPHIVAERRQQHARIDRATAYSLRDQWNERVRRSWNPDNA